MGSGHAPMARCSSGIRTIDASSQSVPGRCVHKMSKNAATARSSVVIQRTIVSSTSVQNSCAPPMLETVEWVDLFLGIRICCDFPACPCPKDLRTCGDGTVVERSPLDCEFYCSC